MSDAFTPHEPPREPLPEVQVKKHRFSSIWLIPIVAALVAGYLGARSYTEHGPVVKLFFRTADGLSAGQTAVKYKSVVLGTVESIQLRKDRSGVTVRVRMLEKTDGILTDHARFWVEKQHLTTTDISDIVSGTYIQVDPGEPGGKPQTVFTGLENQPALPADEPGTTYTIDTQRLGSITAGAPVFYRDINVGKVLGYEIGDGTGPITLHVFVRSPYDAFVKSTSYFWNASGFSVKMGPNGLSIELQSLQTVLAGGIAFGTPVGAMKMEQADGKRVFSLYEDRRLAEAGSYGRPVACVTYMQSSVKDLAPGSAVQIFGIDVGEVTDVRLVVDPQGSAKVRVAFELEPERVFGADSGADAGQIIGQLVQNGMRVKMESSSLIAGTEVLSLEFAPKTEVAEVSTEDGLLVLPGEAGGGGMDGITGALGDIAAKLDRIPFDQIGQHLDHLVMTADKTIGGPEMQQAVKSLEATLANAQELTEQAKQNLGPAMQRLPQISQQLQDAVTQANAFMASVNNGYGQDSDFQRSTKRVLDEANEAARSIRLLADYLDHHPEALIEGKAPDKGADKNAPPADKDMK